MYATLHTKCPRGNHCAVDPAEGFQTLGTYMQFIEPFFPWTPSWRKRPLSPGTQIGDRRTQLLHSTVLASYCTLQSSKRIPTPSYLSHSEMLEGC